MAVVSATTRDVTIQQGPFDQPTNGTNYTVVDVYFDSNGSNVTSGTDTLDVTGLAAVIQGFVRDGKTRTMVGGQVAPWQHIVSSAGIAYGYTLVTSSAPQVDLVPKSASDWTTNATVAAGSFQQPAAIVVTVQES